MADFYSLPGRTTRDIFLSAFFRVLSRQPYQDIKIVDICHEAGMSRKTFYTHFRDKDDLLTYFAQTISLCYSATDDKSGYAHYFSFFYQMQDSIALLLKNDLWYDVSHRITQLYKDLLYPRDWSLLLDDQTAKRDLFIEFVGYGCARLVELWCKNGFRESPEELSALLEQVLPDSTLL